MAHWGLSEEADRGAMNILLSHTASGGFRWLCEPEWEITEIRTRFRQVFGGFDTLQTSRFFFPFIPGAFLAQKCRRAEMSPQMPAARASIGPRATRPARAGTSLSSPSSP